MTAAVRGGCDNCGWIAHEGGEGCCECECHRGVELAAGLRKAEEALRYITQPTMSYNDMGESEHPFASDAHIREFVMTRCDERAARLALATCIEIARRALGHHRDANG